ncbi:DUF4433 domain-containing protein [Nitrosomonas sp.]|uniref:type II toxin-antitoxin system toxin DNA ADP-ribosyl transferase DarT n=1 Tax=Nitrosomonas sp. TaxID=42353 RepID=UPI0037C962AF
MINVPSQPKIYHIVHIDRLASIVADGFLWCDAKMVQQKPIGTTIGMDNIKQRRLTNCLNSYPDLHVGDCVPFYFCPRSVMLYLIYCQNPDLAYRGGQGPILHLESDMNAVVAWANTQSKRWAFTNSNAGSYYFSDYNDLIYLKNIDWDAVQATSWKQHKEYKQAEFLIEHCFPWSLVERIGVYSRTVYSEVANTLPAHGHRPKVEILKE